MLEKGEFGDFQLSEFDVTTSESSPNVTIPFELSAKQPTPTSIDYEITPITLNPASDLAPTTGRVLLDSNAAEGKIVIPITDDNLGEYIETFRVVLKRAGGGPLVNPLANSALVRITDNDQAGPNRTHHVRGGRFFIPALGNPAGQPSGPAPITLPVSGVTGNITDVQVAISDLTHAAYVSLDIILESPDGTFCKLLSDLNFTGQGGTPIENVNLTISEIGLVLSPNQLLSSGTYQPYDFNSGPDNLLDNTSVTNAATQLSVFDGKNPNGTWKLHIIEAPLGETPESPIGGGVLQGGYGLIIETDAGPASPSITITDFMTSVNDPNFLTIHYVGTAGRGYRMQTSPDLTTGNWTTVTNVIIATGAPEQLTFPRLGAERHFVRFIEEPE